MDETYYFESSEMLYEYMTEHKYEVNEYIYDKIRNYLLMEMEMDYLTLFYYEKDGMILKIDISLDKDKLIKPLKNCLDRFVELEAYERCSECLKLIKSIEE
jgi:hypothetical protein